jgi:hypothetical protein
MDHRTVPVEVLREFARSQVELSSIRLVAEDAGVGRSTVHKFISAGTIRNGGASCHRLFCPDLFALT